jgi:hypothetical protein
MEERSEWDGVLASALASKDGEAQSLITAGRQTRYILAPPL